MNHGLRWPRAADDGDAVDRASLGDLLAVLALLGAVVTTLLR